MRISKKSILFRSSELWNLMIEPKTKKERESGAISKTTESFLIDKIGQLKYNIIEEAHGKEIDKGNYAEGEAITLLSEHDNVLYVKNKEHLSNKYITGTPDIITKDTVIDTKCPYKWGTFSKAGVTKQYEWQLRGYMMLTEKKKAILAYCLVNLPEHLLYDELRRQSYYNGIIDDSDEYDALEERIRLNMTYDRIPVEKKVRKFLLEYDRDKESKIISAVNKAREWIINNWDNY